MIQSRSKPKFILDRAQHQSIDAQDKRPDDFALLVFDCSDGGRFLTHPVQTGQYLIQMIDMVHELARCRVIRMLEKQVSFERGVPGDLNFLVHRLGNFMRGHVFNGFIGHNLAILKRRRRSHNSPGAALGCLGGQPDNLNGLLLSKRNL
jgi:hypothetical protein